MVYPLSFFRGVLRINCDIKCLQIFLPLKFGDKFFQIVLTLMDLKIVHKVIEVILGFRQLLVNFLTFQISELGCLATYLIIKEFQLIGHIDLQTLQYNFYQVTHQQTRISPAYQQIKIQYHNYFLLIFFLINQLDEFQNQQISKFIIYFSKRIKMQSAKGSQQYKFNGYDVIITPFSEKKLEITVVDSFEKIQFHEKLLVLNHIGTATLLKALQKKMLEIKMDIRVKKTAESAVLEISVLVASQFLKPVQEVIYLKKTRDISESEILKNAVGLLSSKIRAIKQNDKNGPNIVRCGPVQQNQKSYSSGSSYDQIASITLPKGKYLITLSYFTKATNQWMYVYFNQTQQVIQNCGFYIPTTSNFVPITIRKVHTVNADGEKVTFNTYCAQSYPFICKNIFVTAQEIL